MHRKQQTVAEYQAVALPYSLAQHVLESSTWRWIHTVLQATKLGSLEPSKKKPQAGPDFKQTADSKKWIEKVSLSIGRVRTGHSGFWSGWAFGLSWLRVSGQVQVPGPCGLSYFWVRSGSSSLFEFQVILVSVSGNVQVGFFASKFGFFQKEFQVSFGLSSGF